MVVVVEGGGDRLTSDAIRVLCAFYKGSFIKFVTRGRRMCVRDERGKFEGCERDAINNGTESDHEIPQLGVCKSGVGAGKGRKRGRHA